jgi:molybdopterin/thiamine biosynthesis adenylyltransferase
MLAEIDAAARQPAGWAQEQLRQLHGHKARGEESIALLALGYPGANDREEWLFLRSELAVNSKYGSKWGKADHLGYLQVASFETAPADRNALMRRTGHTAEVLAGQQVLIFGLGSLGSSIALLLAKAGIERLHLVDSAHLRPANAVRHAAGLEHTGSLKVEAMRAVIASHAPDCQVTTAGATSDPQQLAEWIRSASVVVDATANSEFSLLLNELSLHVGRPAIYTATYRRAALGRIRVVRPGQDACLVCYESGYAPRAEYPTIPPADEGSFPELGCAVPAVEASAVDIESTANWTARSTIALLGDTLRGNHCLLVHAVLPDVPEALQQIGIHWGQWPPIPGCAACRSEEPSP